MKRAARREEGPRVLGFAERISLFVTAMHRDQAEALFAGLAEPLARSARAFHDAAVQWDSARRQARLSHEFGVRPETIGRVRELLKKSQGPLRAALIAALPPAARRELSELEGGEQQELSEAVRAVAGRLVKEAWR